jgi:hypothetical protein
MSGRRIAYLLSRRPALGWEAFWFSHTVVIDHSMVDLECHADGTPKD